MRTIDRFKVDAKKIIVILILLNPSNLMAQNTLEINETGIGNISLGKNIKEICFATSLKFFDKKENYLFGCDYSRVFFIERSYFPLFFQFNNLKDCFIIVDEVGLVKAINILFQDDYSNAYNNLKSCFGPVRAVTESKTSEVVLGKSFYWVSNSKVKFQLRVNCSLLNGTMSHLNRLFIHSQVVSENIGELMVSSCL